MKTDARVRYTKMRIHQAFMELLRKKPVRKITVTEICKMAEINRATFYKHYLDVYDLLEKTEEDISRSFQEKMSHFHVGTGREVIRELLQMMEENKDLFGIIFSRNGDPSFAIQLIGKFFPVFASNLTKSEREGKTRTGELARAYYAFISAGTAGMAGYWLQEDPSDEKITSEELADRIERLAEYVRKEADA